MEVRSGETNKTWYRTDRFLYTNGDWYFLTRENTQEGPFRSREEAHRELQYYIRKMVNWSFGAPPAANVA